MLSTHAARTSVCGRTSCPRATTITVVKRTCSAPSATHSLETSNRVQLGEPPQHQLLHPPSVSKPAHTHKVTSGNGGGPGGGAHLECVSPRVDECREGALCTSAVGGATWRFQHEHDRRRNMHIPHRILRWRLTKRPTNCRIRGIATPTLCSDTDVRKLATDCQEVRLSHVSAVASTHSRCNSRNRLPGSLVCNQILNASNVM